MDSEQYRGLASFRYALRRFLAASEAISRDGGVTPQQYQALLAIKTTDDAVITIKELAEQLLLTHHAAVQLVDRLAKAGLAERGRSEEDRRSVLLRLTDVGEAFARFAGDETSRRDASTGADAERILEATEAHGVVNCSL